MSYVCGNRLALPKILVPPGGGGACTPPGFSVRFKEHSSTGKRGGGDFKYYYDRSEAERVLFTNIVDASVGEPARPDPNAF